VWDSIDRRPVNIQVRLRQPLVQRYILILVALEQFQKYESLGPRILDLIRKRLLDVANIPFLEIHGAGITLSGENRHPSFASYVILPFIGVLMPV
jgi:hypothetical protein